MEPMTDERLNQIPWDAKQEITRLRAELAETQAEMKPLAAHVQRDFEQAAEIARLLTRNEKLQAELAECQRNLEDCMRFENLATTTVCPSRHVHVEVADKMAQLLRDWMGTQPFPEEGPSQFEQNVCAALSAYEAAKGPVRSLTSHPSFESTCRTTPPTASAEERGEGLA